MCSTHPGRRASITCPCCGSYACEECTLDTLWGDILCEACARHGRAQYPLPFERRPGLGSFLRTAYLVLADTRQLFGHFPDGSVASAVTFATAIAVFLGLISSMMTWLFKPSQWILSLPTLPMTVLHELGDNLLVSALFVAPTAVGFHVASALLGGRVALATSLRATCYVSAVHVINVAILAANTILIGNTPVTIILRLVQYFFLVWGLSLVAERRFRLSERRAWVAGFAPVAMLVALNVGLIIAMRLFQARG